MPMSWTIEVVVYKKTKRVENLEVVYIEGDEKSRWRKEGRGKYLTSTAKVRDEADSNPFDANMRIRLCFES